MNERSELISKLARSIDSRTAYVKAKLGVLVPSQIRSLRLHSDMPRQADLAKEAGLQQSRISMFETPGAANVTLETLARLAAAFRVGLIVKFVPFSEMLRWENSFSPSYDVRRLEEDEDFFNAAAESASIQAIRGNMSVDNNAVGSAHLVAGQVMVMPPPQSVGRANAFIGGML